MMSSQDFADIMIFRFRVMPHYGHRGIGSISKKNQEGMRKCMQHNTLVKIQSMNKHFFLYLKHTYGFLTIFKVLLNHRLRFFCSHFSYTGSKVCRVSVPSKNSVSGERATLVVTFSLEGGCCSGMPGSGSVSQLLSTKGTI